MYFNPNNIDYKNVLVRASAILTTGYVAGTTIDAAQDANQLVLTIDFTKGGLTTADFKVEFSNDNVTFYQESIESFVAGVGTISLANRVLSATGKYRIAIPILDRYIKISAKGVGGSVAGSLMKIDAVIGTV